MKNQIEYADVEQYLRTFPTESKNFGALLHLVLTGIENLRKNISNESIRENAHSISNAQASFLQQLLEGRADSLAWFKDDIAHSSQTGLL
jgi:hypothetical protein